MPVSRMRCRCAVAGLLAVALVGCASAPPVATSEATAGDSAQAITDRGYLVVPVYQFALDGQHYALAKGYSGEKSYDLVFIGATLACTRNTPNDELTAWEWVGEPDGLEYLASRLRQACGLETWTEPRQPSAAAKLSAEQEKAERLATAVASLPFAIVLSLLEPFPSLLASPWVAADKDSAKNLSAGQARMQLGLTRAETVARLGEPTVEFPLPAVSVTVLAYLSGAVSGHQGRYYVGLKDDHVLWMHAEHLWLHGLATAALEEKQPRKD